MAKVVPSDLASSSKGLSAHGSMEASHSITSSVVPTVPAPKPKVERWSMIHGMRSIVRHVFTKTGWYDSIVATCIRKFLRGKVFALVAMLSLFVALFFAEIFTIAQVPTNTVLDIILTVVLALFAFEFIGLSLTDASYLLGFFFWMDLVGTVSMIFDISYLAGTDVTSPEYVNRETQAASRDNVIVVRAARAAKLGARAGRISRVLKILRFLPFLLRSEDDSNDVKMAKVISNELTNVLSTRVAFLTICIVVVMPLFTMFTYPEMDDSMGAWTELLAQSAASYYEAVMANNESLIATTQQSMLDEVARFATFYDDLSYGPFAVEYGESEGLTFSPLNDFNFSSVFSFEFLNPERRSSSRVVTQGHIRTSFDLSTPKQQEAAASIGLLVFIIIIMCGFGLVTSSSISVIALQPLERMLLVVRERCSQIFKYTHDLQDNQNQDKDDDGKESYDDMEHISEFVLLEKVVGKLAAIAHLSTAQKEPEIKENMNENEIMVLNWMQGTQVTENTGRNGRISLVPGATEVVLQPGQSSTRLEAELGLGLERQTSLCTSNLPDTVIANLQTDRFNSLDLGKEAKIAVTQYILTASPGCATWVHANVRDSVLSAFVTAVESKYLPNPFHNFAHAVDVAYTIRRFFMLIEADFFLSETAQFWLLVAAIGHDIGHSAVNNQYLIETAHELALSYNDRSPLENMHCAKLFQLLKDPGTNVFAEVEKEPYKEMRKGMITAILHTDVTKHNEMVKEMSMLYQMNSEAFDEMMPADPIIASGANVQLVVNGLLHGADVGNPMKPWELCQKIAYLCLDEFFAQGDSEKAAGIPVQMLNDREKVNRPNSQIGFIEFVIAPMVTSMVHMFPALDFLAEHLGSNIQSWCEVWQDETCPSAEAAGKVIARVQKVKANMDTLMRRDQYTSVA